MNIEQILSNRLTKFNYNRNRKIFRYVGKSFESDETATVSILSVASDSLKFFLATAKGPITGSPTYSLTSSKTISTTSSVLKQSTDELVVLYTVNSSDDDFIATWSCDDAAFLSLEAVYA